MRTMKHVAIICALVCIVLLSPSLTLAQNPPPPSSQYNLLAPIGTWITGPYDLAGDGFSEYLRSAFFVGIGIAVLLAVVMLVICGVRIIATAGSVSAKTEAKHCILNALFGLLLAIGSWVLLNTINPALVGTSVNMPQTDPINPSQPPPPISDDDYTPIHVPPPAIPPENPPTVPPGSSSSLTVQFSTSVYSTSETAGVVTLDVIATGSGGGTVSFHINPNTAQPNIDYIPITGTLTFSGPSTQTITIPLISDGISATSKKFTVILLNPSGDIALGRRDAATVIIQQVPNPVIPPIVITPPPQDNALPVITITAPTTTVYVNASTSPVVNLAFVVTDDLSIKTVTVSEVGRISPSQFWTICDNQNCPSLAMTHNIPIRIEPTDYGIHTITVRACDSANKCAEQKMRVYVQEPCVNSSQLVCNTLPSGKSEVSPYVCSTSGTNANGVAVTSHAVTGNASGATHSYEFMVSDPAVGGGWIHVVSGIISEYPPYFFPYTSPLGFVSTGITSGQCPAPLVCTTGDTGITECIPGSTAWCGSMSVGDSGSWSYCPPIPQNVVVSVSDLPGDLSNRSGANASTSPVYGDCGMGFGLPVTEVNIYISASTTGPGICTVLPNSKYYVNIKTIPELSPYDPNYTLFWDGIFQ